MAFLRNTQYQDYNSTSLTFFLKAGLNWLLYYFLLIIVLSCNRKVDATFHISNYSEDQQNIPLYLVVNNDTIFKKLTEFSVIRPDLTRKIYKKSIHVLLRIRKTRIFVPQI